MNSIYEWLDEACRPLRYKPDREAAYKELKDHYQDHREYLLEQGAYPGAAERQALEAMGDPAETGRLLSAAYQPVLTFFWRLSRWLLIVLAVLVVFAGVLRIVRRGDQKWFVKDPEDQILSSMAFYKDEDPDTKIVEGHCGGTAELGEYKFTITRAISVRMKDPSRPGQYLDSVVLILKAKGPLTLGAPPDMKYWVTAQDDKLVRYNNISAFGHDLPDDEGYVHMNYCFSSFGTHYYSVVITGTSPDIKNIELDYAHWNSTMSLQAVFSEGAAS